MVRAVAIALSSAAFLALADGACQDVTVDAENPSCFTNLTWAMDTGINSHSDFYTGYALTASSPRVDFQCALAHMVGPADKHLGHNCTTPCTSGLAQCQTAAPSPVPTPAPSVAAAANTPPPTTPTTSTTTTTTTTQEASSMDSSSSLPWWAWLLLALALLLCIAAAAFLAMTGGKKKGSAPEKKRKRVLTQAANTREAQVADTTETAPLTTYYVQPPVPAVQTVQMPMAQPVQPLPTMQYVQAAPQAMPPQVMSPQHMSREQAEALFDQLDTNHMGALSRAQMDGFMRGAGRV